MRIHLITAESPESRRLRGSHLIQFPQLMMPLIAALTPREHDVHHTDEIVERLDLERPADLVGITAPTPSALHAYEVADAFRRRRVLVVMGGPISRSSSASISSGRPTWSGSPRPRPRRCTPMRWPTRSGAGASSS